MGKTIACIIARTGSSRLPEKVIQKVTPEFSMLGFIVERVKRCQRVDEIYICTTREPEDAVLETLAQKHQVEIYRGSTHEVIERFISVGQQTGAEKMIRITGDNVFTSVEYLDLQIEFMDRESLDYVRIIDAPLGATAEVMSFRALMDCYQSIDPSVSEYLLMYMFDPDKYRCGVIKPFPEDHSGITITVDTLEDIYRTREILKHFPGNALDITLMDIVEIVRKHQVPHSTFSMDMKVKMPHDHLMTYREFKQDMAERESKSIRWEL